MTPQHRPPGWGTIHSEPSSESGGMLRKSRVGKEKSSLRCEVCEAEDAEQYECLCVLCGQCFKGHEHARRTG